MQKIPFNDRFLLTQGVLEEWKKKTRRAITYPKTFRGKPVAGFHVYRRPSDGFISEICMYDEDEGDFDEGQIQPKYKVGEVVAVSQSYKDAGYICHYYGDTDEFMFLIKDGSERVVAPIAVTNKMFVRAELMPHQIRITDVHPERLQDISDEDCLAEGIIRIVSPPSSEAKSYAFYDKAIKIKVKMDKEFRTYTGYKEFDTPREAYAALIDKISGKGTWDSNPWVWAYTFELVK